MKWGKFRVDVIVTIRHELRHFIATDSDVCAQTPYALPAAEESDQQQTNPPI